MTRPLHSRNIWGWDLASGAIANLPVELQQALAPVPADASITAISADGARSARANGTHVDLFDLPAHGVLERSWHHGGSILALTFGPDKDWLFSSAEDRTLRLWDVTKTNGERHLLRLGYRRALGHGFIEVDGTGQPTADAKLNVTSSPYAKVGELHYAAGGDRALLAVSDWGPWLCDFSWSTRAQALEPKVVRARQTLDAQPPDTEALRTVGEWFALNANYGSAIAYFERAQAAEATVDEFLLGCCYLSQSEKYRPSPAQAATQAEYQSM